MSISKQFANIGWVTLVRQAMFYGYHRAKVEEGKTNISENARDFCDAKLNDELDPESIKSNYYRFYNQMHKK